MGEKYQNIPTGKAASNFKTAVERNPEIRRAATPQPNVNRP
jgi:hypothetical protein